AAARRPHDQNRAAAFDRKRNAFEYFQLVERLVQIFDFKYRAHLNHPHLVAVPEPRTSSPGSARRRSSRCNSEVPIVVSTQKIRATAKKVRMATPGLPTYNVRAKRMTSLM